MLEKMDAFFEARLEGYDAHMLNNIQGAGEFYPFTADCLPLREAARILDLMRYRTRAGVLLRSEPICPGDGDRSVPGDAWCSQGEISGQIP